MLRDLQGWDTMESQEARDWREETGRGKCRLNRPKGALSPELASCLLPDAVTLLEALVVSSKLEDAVKNSHEAVCLCMGQAVVQVSPLHIFFRIESNDPHTLLGQDRAKGGA